MIRQLNIFIFAVLFISCRTTSSSPGAITNSVIHYGADPSGQSDSSTAFINALKSQSSKIIVPKGTYIISQTIEIKKHLYLETGVQIIRRKTSNNNGPIFYLNNNYAFVEGASKSVLIKSEKESPEGIIKIGHFNDQIKGSNILYCTVQNLTIKGVQNEEGNSVGVLLFNAQIAGDKFTTSYFHTIRDLVIQNFNTGINLKGHSNANSISNVLFFNVGKGPDDEAILFQGALENRVYDFFHHFSPDAVTVRMVDYKNITPMFNYIFGGISEQGGKKALCADIQSGKFNVIDINCNVYRGSKTHSDFKKDKNVILTRQ